MYRTPSEFFLCLILPLPQGTHTMEFSPRYVEHHAKQKAQELVAQMQGTTDPCTTQCGLCEAPATPEQPTLPMAPRPPSYGPVGQPSSKAIRRPAYGPLGGAGRAIDWEAQPNRAVPPQGGVSGSGDWGDIQHSLSGILEVDHAALTVDEDPALIEEAGEASCDSSFGSSYTGGWAGVHGQAAANYDSSYDSQSSQCGGEAEAFAKALEQAFVMPASSIPAPPKVHPMEPESAEPREGQPMPLEPEQAGLEFASGVHLIEEMENQVKQWEESEGTREVAYNAWVQQQMMRAVSMGSRPPSS